jgi:hypothetical protein
MAGLAQLENAAMFERFTDRARRALVVAREEARLLGHPYIGTEHLLLALSQGDGVAAQALASLDVPFDAVRQQVVESVGRPSGEVDLESPPFTPKAKKVLEYSLREALQLGHSYIGTEHLLLGLVREAQGEGGRILEELGVEPARLRQAVIGLIVVDIATTPPRPRDPGAGPTPRPGSRPLACSFCGRRPPESGPLHSGVDAFVCEHCIHQWATNPDPGRAGRSPVDPTQAVRPTGPPPDDPAAVAGIAAAYAAIGRPSEDGESVPSVDGGENLGPTLARARMGRQTRHPLPDDARVDFSTGEIAFTDADHAAVWFTVSVNGHPVLRDRRGDAVRVDGTWKVARSTFCQLVALAGIRCPPPAAEFGG